ncbi:atp synthase f1 subunit delta [Sutcliffiella cohnii]|uniref:Atp synthase f1 subunit delta n=1 Tax=Sutcliffiella cohnii TaxID=33932 RepID=A0A223KKX2_9BACI|nr:DUF4275 family protein [Sutcliffiella cohnii]AST90003.1 atp synthase f1 subunit delta [Sutcliffiella cohnii]MED4018360.1 DUF4275 family protein [Sutcliffiella cohnii]
MREKKQLSKSTIKFYEIPKWGRYLRGKWEASFASHLSTVEKEAIYFKSFLWHLCSWEKVDCYEKHDAIKMFERQEKMKCTIFYEHTEEAYLIDNAKNLSVKDLPHDQFHMYYGDMYVMDWNGQWTFIMTHESECGPYFINASRKSKKRSK